MQPQRETITDSLSDIIHIIGLGSKSGTLTVERGEAKTREEGFIAFVNGRIIEARIGQSSGQLAFNYLSTWTTCRFSFIDSPTTDATTLYRSAHFSSSKEENTQNSVSFPNIGYPNTSPLPQQNNDMYISNGGSVAGLAFPSRSQTGEVALQQPEHMNISRLQKRLLLLINGQRSLNELARLISRSPEETQILFEELERAGLVSQ